MIIDKVKELISKARLSLLRPATQPTKHPGSKRQKDKKKTRAAQKRAKMSRKRNRRG